MSVINLVMVLHCHQPVGNFDHVFEKAHDQCYRPVLDLLAAHPLVRVGLHFSGPLLEWLDQHHPDTLDLMADLARQGQAEMLSGGFFEPLLASIPQQDARGQVRMMNDYLDRRLGCRPTGFWLTERIWDPSLPATLAGTDMKYTVVDDTHLYYAGIDRENIFGPYLTEREGHTLGILATPMIMRYLIPFKPVEDVIGQLRAWEESGIDAALYGDDGEKFGLWPGTHEWVIQKGWLERFFQALEANSDWLACARPGDYFKRAEPLGRVYIPQASYEEMTEWALPPERARTLESIIDALKREDRWESWRPFIRGGVWDNFLVKYDETNRMHKKMIDLSARAGECPEARESVWRAQCNCAYWHGVFGGLYMGHLRRAIYEHLLKAQAVLVKADGGRAACRRFDLDRDGLDEIVVESPWVCVGAAPSRGGRVFEISHLPKAINLMDILTRRPEAYHHKLWEYVRAGDHGHDHDVASIHDQVKVKEEGLERYLVYDPDTRASLLDHFWNREATPEELAGGTMEEAGDFITGRYETDRMEPDGGGWTIGLSRAGRANGSGIFIQKTIRVGPGPMMNVDYCFKATDGAALRLPYACEFNLTLYSDQDEHRYLFAPEHNRRREAYETGREDNVTRFELVNKGDGLKSVFLSSTPLTVMFYPLMTVSMSEDGFEKSYQGTSLYFTLPLEIGPENEFGFTLNLELVDI